LIEEQAADQERCTAEDCCCGSMAVTVGEPRATLGQAAALPRAAGSGTQQGSPGGRRISLDWRNFRHVLRPCP